ncbi:MAG: zf-HC2 domain-containing protein [Rhodothermales bacterium]
MSTESNRPLAHAADINDDTALEALNLFVDGELGLNEQGPLFAHLAECVSCRRDLEHIMRFRRMSRSEHLVVPPSVDDGFFKKLDALRVSSIRHNRADDRRSVWQRKAPVSFRAAVITAVLVFLTGLLFPSNTPDYARPGYVVGADETIEFPDVSLTPTALATLYVFYPGVTVEAAQHDD